MHVEVHPILRGLALGHLEEEHPGADTIRTDALGRFPTRPRPRSVRAMGGANAVVETILKSPLHRVMSGKLALIRYQGSRSATEYTLPVQYADTHGGLVVVVGQARHEDLVAELHHDGTDPGPAGRELGGDDSTCARRLGRSGRRDPAPAIVCSQVSEGREVARGRHARGSGRSRRRGVAPSSSMTASSPIGRRSEPTAAMSERPLSGRLAHRWGGGSGCDERKAAIGAVGSSLGVARVAMSERPLSGRLAHRSGGRGRCWVGGPGNSVTAHL